MTHPLMPKATAVWLIDNTSLTFEQIAEFCGLHPLEVSGIADGDVAAGIKGSDPTFTGELTREEIARCEKNTKARLQYQRKEAMPETKPKGARYTPLSKRQDRPAAIAWLVRYHPELTDTQIAKLIGSTKPTIQAVRNKTHWNSPNIRPIDPVALGMCSQVELDTTVQKAADRLAAENVDGGEQKILSDDDRKRLLSTEDSLQQPQTSKYGDYAAAALSPSTRAPKFESTPENVKEKAESFFTIKTSEDS